MNSPVKDSRFQKATRIARHLIAFLSLIVAATVVLTGRWNRCSVTTYFDGSKQTRSRTCQPYGIPEVLLLGGLAVFLLLPDLAEVEISGFFKLRREVEKQAVRQDRLESQLVLLTQTVSQNTSVAVQVGNLEESQQRVEQLAPLIEEPESIHAGQRLREIATPHLPVGSTAEKLSVVASLLQEAVVLAEASENESGLTDRERQRLKRWKDLFKNEIGVVEALAERSRRGPRPSAEELERGLNLGTRILDLLRQALASAKS
jgi:hypothetical protein